LTTTIFSRPNEVVERVREAGFCFLPAGEAYEALARASVERPTETDFRALASTWEAMPEDAYMADGGRYRRRRYAVLRAAGASEDTRDAPERGWTVCWNEPHFQSLDYNRLNGGVARHFETIAPETLENAWFRATVTFGRSLFEALFPAPAPGPGWPLGAPSGHVEVHQFRIEAGVDQAGQPTPEGMHRDGVSFVLVMLIRRENVASGTTEVALADGSSLASFTLTQPFDLALVDDERVLHGVTAIQPIDPEKPAFRDVLVVTYRWERPDEVARFADQSNK
jgi:hypothetical protein